MPYRQLHSFNHHYSDWSYADTMPVGSVIAVYVDAASDANDDHIADQSVSGNVISLTANRIADNYPGYIYCAGQDIDIADYPLLYNVLGNRFGGTDPNTVNMRTWPSISGKFRLPDLRMKRINGPGGIDGPGSLTPDEATMEVGTTGGQWYMSKARQLDEYTIGTVRVSGYNDCIGFVGGTLSGTAGITIGPLQTRILPGPPPHGHLLLSSVHDERNGMGMATSTGTTKDNGASTNYVSNRAGISSWSPDGAYPGTQAEHTHYLAEYQPTNSLSISQYSYDTSGTYLSTGGTDYANSYTHPEGKFKVGHGSQNSAGQQVDFFMNKVYSISPGEAGITLNEGTVTMTGGEQLAVSATIVPQTAVPLILKYFRVKYLIKAF